MSTTDLHCACGRVHLQADDAPMVSVACCCTSCQAAAKRLSKLPGAPNFVESNGTTHYLFYRKDRIRFVAGQEHLKEFYLSDTAKTRRVIGTCCNTPVFLEFKGGHWLSLYACLWPEGTVPPLELRTMASDLPAGVTLDNSVPNPKTHTPWFYWRIFKAWVQMGFRSPKIDVNGGLNV